MASNFKMHSAAANISYSITFYISIPSQPPCIAGVSVPARPSGRRCQYRRKSSTQAHTPLPPASSFPRYFSPLSPCDPCHHIPHNNRNTTITTIHSASQLERVLRTRFPNVIIDWNGRLVREWETVTTTIHSSRPCLYESRNLVK